MSEEDNLPWKREEDARIPTAGGGGSAKRVSVNHAMNMDRWMNVMSGGGRLSFWVDSQATAIRYIVRKFPDVEAVGPEGITLPEAFVLIWQDETGEFEEYSFFGADESYHNALFGAALIGLRARGLLDFQERNGIYLGKYFLPVLSGEAPEDSEVLKAVYNEIASEPKNSLKMWFENKSGKWGQDETTKLTIQSLVERGILEEGTHGDMFSESQFVPKDLHVRSGIIDSIRKLVSGEVAPEDDKRSMALLALCRTADLRDSSTNVLMQRIFGKENLEDWIQKVDDLVCDFLPPPGISTEEIEKMLERMPADTQAHLKSDAFKEECKAKFTECDVSKTGTLDPPELVPAAKACLPPEYMDSMSIDEDSLEHIILMFDSNENGKIELDEFTDFMKWILGMKIIEYFNQKKC
jgi:hypothetical protein